MAPFWGMLGVMQARFAAGAGEGGEGIYDVTSLDSIMRPQPDVNTPDTLDTQDKWYWNHHFG
jgi:hypothetical protein